MKIKVLSALVLALAFSGCATLPLYIKAAENGGYGYAEQKIENNRYRVTFNGNSSTSRQEVENFLLYRAAELTVESGNDYFTMLENDTDEHKSYSVQSRFPRYGRRAYFLGPREYYYNYPYYSYGFDWGPEYERTVHEFTRYSAEAYIIVGSGQKPVNDPNAFDARDVLRNLDPIVAKEKA
ncbi:MAG: hypothetical protein HKO02_01855 [Hyphomonadaceae bacterium]|nr:hypothetical protein [Hyphomonadaceae bacterium]